MGAIRAQVVLHTTDAVPENYLTNSWCFMGADPFADVAALETALTNFYSTWFNYAGAGIAGGAIHDIKWYDLPGVTPNYPLRETVVNFGAAPTGAALPAEVSLVLSFQGARTPGFPQARRRGRIYLGTVQQTYNSGGRPTASILTGMAAAATTLKTAVDALASDTEWAVWSVADQAPVDITNGWLDNAWDTQRRRGVVRTARTTWS